MAAITTLAPVFFMLVLGMLAHKFNWVSKEHKEGANAVVFNILFPILVFKLLATATISFEHIWIILYVFVAYSLAIVLGKLLLPKLVPEFGPVAPYLLACCEGGSVALPLYLSIVGTSSNTVIFDIAGTAMCFGVINVLVAKECSAGASMGELVKNILSNSFVIAVLLGLALNFTGIYGSLMASSFGEAITACLQQATNPIVGMILFILGFDLSIDKETLVPILKMMGVKTVYYAIVIAGFFVLFPSYMSDHIFMMAPLIYFMCPTGFGLLPIVSPLYRNKQDKVLTSGFVSMYIFVTLIVYVCVVLFVA